MKQSAETRRILKVNAPILQPALVSLLFTLALLFLASCGVFGRQIPIIGPPPANLDVAALMQTGQQVYQDKCAKCHGLDGLGIPGFYNALAADPIVTQEDAGEVVQIVLYGITKPPSYFSNRNQMAPMPYLADQDIAAVVTFIRHSWGNQASAVSPDQVARVRRGN